MFRHVFSFELGFRSRQALLYILAVVFLLLTFAAVTTDSVQIGGGLGAVAKNSPYVIVNMLNLMTAVGVLATTAFVATAVNRDFELGTYSLFFTTGLDKTDYLFGRFFGSLVAALAPLAGATLGIFLGSLMPWQDPVRIVPFQIAPYLQAWGLFVVPNVLVTGAVFFALATLSRRMLLTYVGVVAFFVLYGVSQSFIGDLDNDWLAALSDPFGLAAFEMATRYWTVGERNTLLLPLTGELLWNRVLWTSVGIGTLAMTAARFRMIQPEHGRGKRTADDSRKPDPTLHSKRLRRVAPEASKSVPLQQWAHHTHLLLGATLRSLPFIAIALFALLNVVGGALGTIDELYGTAVLPVTNLMVRVIGGSMSLFIILVVTFYGGELVWRERAAGMNEVFDALPVPDWVPLAAKLTVLIVIQAVLLVIALATTMAVQASKGHFDFEFEVYFTSLLVIALFQWTLLCVLAITAQVFVNHKFLGFGVMVLYFVAQFALPALDFDHHLLLYGSTPAAPYSDMNGYGHFAKALFWYDLCWFFAAIVLVLLANLFWVRGSDESIVVRVRMARRRITRRNTWALAVATFGFFATAGVVLYNTLVINDYVPGDEQERLQAEYERRYKQYENLDQPKITQVDVNVDIYPRERRVRLHGWYEVENRGDRPIEDVHVQLDRRLRIDRFIFPDADRVSSDPEVGYQIYRLRRPLKPSESRRVEYDVTYAAKGFENHGSNTQVVENGTFIDNMTYLPHFGYDPDGELTDPNERRKRDLPERTRALPLDDPIGLARNYISGDADWVQFSATVSTDPDQIAIAPGYLQRSWVEEERRYFRYEMDAPILNFYSFLSARYTVVRDRWNDVAIEIYHHEPHDYNVQKMIGAIKRSLDYFTTSFGPYQHKQVRIIEFPRYASFAQSFPNTIPYSESIGFIADLRDPSAIDYVYYVTAHEVAHQWWGHQVMGGNVQGSTMIVESMAQYSALMVMEKQYGRDQMKRFLRYELDNYLRSRGGETIKEMPLVRVENQAYIHYRKGSLVFYALREYIGEAALNRALAKFVNTYRFAGPPYPNSAALVEAIRKETPPHLQALIDDLFERIILFDNQAVSAVAQPLPDGRFKVTMKLRARKLDVDDQGFEREVPLNDPIQVGVFRKVKRDGVDIDEPLDLRMHQFSEPEATLEWVVDERPDTAGIDPRSLLIDRNPDDNTRTVDIR